LSAGLTERGHLKRRTDGEFTGKDGIASLARDAMIEPR
jgi:hypothetical protein